MLSAVLHTIARHALFTRGDRVLVAASGGPDSMALLAVLWELAPRLGLSLEVATVDHGLRPDAAAERDLVAERARALGLVCHRVPVDVRSGAIRGGVQQAARDARLAALAALATARGCVRVALGHQADDQAETILFRIIRGTDAKGLAGIPYRRDAFVRPLLDVTRARIVAYLRRRSLPYALDPSNADLRFARARIRHTILPLLRRENPRIDEALRRLTKVAPSGGAAAVAEAAGKKSAALDGASGLHVSARLAAQLEAASAKGGTRSFDVSGGRRLTVRYGRLVLEPQSKAPAPPGATAAVSIPGPGRYVLSPETAVLVGAGGPAPAADEACFDGDQLSWPLVLRHRRPGDRIRPRGGRGSRKLSDLLIDAKIARDERRALPVVTDADGELLFVPGVRPSQLATPSEKTRRWIALRRAPGLTLAAASADDGTGLAKG